MANGRMERTCLREQTHIVRSPLRKLRQLVRGDTPALQSRLYQRFRINPDSRPAQRFKRQIFIYIFVAHCSALLFIKTIFLIVIFNYYKKKEGEHTHTVSRSL